MADDAVSDLTVRAPDGRSLPVLVAGFVTSAAG